MYFTNQNVYRSGELRLSNSNLKLLLFNYIILVYKNAVMLNVFKTFPSKISHKLTISITNVI